ncbi:hypothetical protein [Microvirga roseola]|uniref:hypothetical protein n=1 Tax=Microvirga roseola TaxID=2883126 RepID=UPI001E47C7AC|nr:hypothetical protein [Microvirga roseola]
MKRIFLTTAIGALALGATGAMAQQAYGPAVVNPGPGQQAVTGTCAPVPNASGSQVTNPCTYGNTASPGQPSPATTGSIYNPLPPNMVSPPPVPNASGSQVTNPSTYRNSLPPRY